jgi:hypothetical protein
VFVNTAWATPAAEMFWISVSLPAGSKVWDIVPPLASTRLYLRDMRL